MISAMSDPVFDRGQNIRTSPKAQRALNRVVAHLKASDRVKWKGGAVSKEAVVNASWLMLDAMDEDELENLMARYVAELELLLGVSSPEEAAPGGEHEPVNIQGADAPQPPHRPSRKKKGG